MLDHHPKGTPPGAPTPRLTGLDVGRQALLLDLLAALAHCQELSGRLGRAGHSTQMVARLRALRGGGLTPTSRPMRSARCSTRGLECPRWRKRGSP